LLRSVSRHFLPVITLLLGASCTLNDPPTIVDGRLRPDAGTGGRPSTPPPPPVAVDAGVVVDAGLTIPPDPPPTGNCTNGQTLPCGPSTEDGNCAYGTRVCVDSVWSDTCIGAVYPQKRLCGASDDKDCDGVSDDTSDATCECIPGTVEPCDTHPGLDGVGACKAGQRTCEASAKGQASHWGACTGSVGPAATDSCTVKGDDANCDAVPNTDCKCVEGEVVPCGSSDVGICKLGTSTCVNQKFTECKGAVLPEARDCSSEDDNDCDGKPDNTIDNVCTCEVGTVEECDTHPKLDGVGVCRPGERTCDATNGGASSSFSACKGAVGPTARRCNIAADNDCNGVLDNVIDTVCQCAIGTVQLCGQHPGLDDIGRCSAGQQLCVAGANNASSAFSACAGSVGPAAADSCTVAGDDATCDGKPNGGCECVVGSNALCADTPATSKCDATAKCVACTANADCSLVTGRTICSAGVCVQCTTDAQCTAPNVCTANTCVAPPPPPPPPPPADTDAGG
jgi:hypothetical protein